MLILRRHVQRGRLRPSLGRGSLCSRHLSRCPYRQLQRLAQSRQVCFAWPCLPGLPEVNAGDTDAGILSDFSYAKPTLEASITQVGGQAGFFWPLESLSFLQGCNIKTPITFGNPTNDKLSERSVRVRFIEFAGSKNFARMS
jgi:hypothetical protein